MPSAKSPVKLQCPGPGWCGPGPSVWPGRPRATRGLHPVRHCLSLSFHCPALLSIGLSLTFHWPLGAPPSPSCAVSTAARRRKSADTTRPAGCTSSSTSSPREHRSPTAIICHRLTPRHCCCDTAFHRLSPPNLPRLVSTAAPLAATVPQRKPRRRPTSMPLPTPCGPNAAALSLLCPAALPNLPRRRVATAVLLPRSAVLFPTPRGNSRQLTGLTCLTCLSPSEWSGRSCRAQRSR